MKRPKVYLAGPITGLTYGGSTEWRDAVKAELAILGIDGASPMRGKTYLANLPVIDDKPREDTLLSSQQSITTRDRFDVMSSDMVIFNFLGATKASIGSCIEIGWSDAFRKPAILVVEKEGNIHDYSMIRAICGWRVDNLDDAIRIVGATLLH